MNSKNCRKRLSAKIHRIWKKILVYTVLIIICIILSVTVFKTPTIDELQPQEVYLNQMSEYTDTRFSYYVFLETDIGDYYYACSDKVKFTQGSKRLNELAKKNERILVYAYPYYDYLNIFDILEINGYQRVVEIHYNGEVVFSIDDFDGILAGKRLIMIIIIILLCFFYYFNNLFIRNAEKL